MGVVVAGEGGAALVAAALGGGPAPSLLVLEGLARPTDWRGSRMLPLDELDQTAVPPGTERLELVAGEPRTRELLKGWAAAQELPVRDIFPGPLSPPPGVRVLAVSSPATGSGKTALVRRLARMCLRLGRAVVVARHPLPNLLFWGRQSPEVVTDPAELVEARTLEEREELAPLVGAGVPVARGLDPEEVLRLAARRAGPGGVVIWDGGGSARPWVRPDLHLLAVDLIRPLPPETRARVEEADVVVLTKADTAAAGQAEEIEAQVREWNPQAAVVLVDMPPATPDGRVLADKRVVVVEDAPSLLWGGLRAGAGALAAKRFRCGVVDPRPFAVGSVRRALEASSGIGPVIPSLGRTAEEVEDLQASIESTPGDLVLWASPADPRGVLGPSRRPVVRVYADILEVAGDTLRASVASVLGDSED